MVSPLLYVCFIVEVVMDHWTDSSPQWAQAWHLGKEPLASASLSLLSYAPPKEPSTPRDARPGTTNMEHSPKRPLSSVRHIKEMHSTDVFISLYVYLILLICCVIQQNTNQLVLHCQFIFLSVSSPNGRKQSSRLSTKSKPKNKNEYQSTVIVICWKQKEILLKCVFLQK